jgi:hypothetical protein
MVWMKKIASAVLTVLLFASCASPVSTPDDLMKLPKEEVFEVRHTVTVPAAVAYRNILERAQRCWQRPDMVVEATSFSSRIGNARLSLRSQPKNMVLVVVEVVRESDTATRLTGRSLAATPARVRDLQNLTLWAEGKQVPCS